MRKMFQMIGLIIQLVVQLAKAALGLLILAAIIWFVVSIVRASNSATTASTPAAAATDVPADTSAPIATPTDAIAAAQTALALLVTPTVSAATWDATTAKVTYQQVLDHPEVYSGRTITWMCAIAKFLGPDPTAGDTEGFTEVGCFVYRGWYNGGVGDGEAMLLVPPTIDTSAMSSGDDVLVRGTIGQIYAGTNGFGGPIQTPSIVVMSLTDKGRNVSAS
jgi:hypothetical protein